MATELVTRTWCDPHQHDDGEKVPGRPYAVAIVLPDGTGATVEIDLCENCAKPFEDLARDAAEYGRPIKAAGSGRRPAVSARENTAGTVQTCPVPGCDYSTTAVSGLGSHVKSAHGRTLPELTGAATHPCPVKGCDRGFGGVQGLASHLRTVHGQTLAEAGVR